MHKRSSQIADDYIDGSSILSQGLLHHSIIQQCPQPVVLETAFERQTFEQLRRHAQLVDSSSTSYSNCSVYEEDLLDGDIVCDPNASTIINLRLNITECSRYEQEMKFASELFRPHLGKQSAIKYEVGTEEYTAVQALNQRLRSQYDAFLKRTEESVNGADETQRQTELNQKLHDTYFYSHEQTSQNIQALQQAATRAQQHGQTNDASFQSLEQSRKSRKTQSEKRPNNVADETYKQKLSSQTSDVRGIKLNDSPVQEQNDAQDAADPVEASVHSHSEHVSSESQPVNVIPIPQFSCVQDSSSDQ